MDFGDYKKIVLRQFLKHDEVKKNVIPSLFFPPIHSAVNVNSAKELSYLHLG